EQDRALAGGTGVAVRDVGEPGAGDIAEIGRVHPVAGAGA
ncbi:MAG: hypothetical protein JWQ26_2938, partial [Modestobacter sp.]|nr:hypothetical protein [Modestobacter sp.]